MISEKLHLLVLLMQGLSLGTVQYNTPAAKTTVMSLTWLTLQEVNTHRTHLNVLTNICIPVHGKVRGSWRYEEESKLSPETVCARPSAAERSHWWCWKETNNFHEQHSGIAKPWIYCNSQNNAKLFRGFLLIESYFVEIETCINGFISKHDWSCSRCSSVNNNFNEITRRGIKTIFSDETSL